MPMVFLQLTQMVKHFKFIQMKYISYSKRLEQFKDEVKLEIFEIVKAFGSYKAWGKYACKSLEVEGIGTDYEFCSHFIIVENEVYYTHTVNNYNKLNYQSITDLPLSQLVDFLETYDK